MAEHFTLVPVSEFCAIELTCPNCKKTKVVVDVSSEKLMPSQCPGCGKEWNGFTNSKITTALEAYARFFAVLAGSEMNPHFRIKDD